jgi:hypothetical protein
MSTLSRIPTSTGAAPRQKRDNTLRVLSADVQTPAYAATIPIVINSNQTLVQPAALSGACTFTVNVGTGLADDNLPFLGDTLTFLLKSVTATQTVTFGTGFASTGTLAVTLAKFAQIIFIFNGTTWVESSRAVTA